MKIGCVFFLFVANLSNPYLHAQKFDMQLLQFKPGVQIYATGLSFSKVNTQFETMGYRPVEDVVSSFSFTGEVIYKPLKAGIGFSYGGGGASSSGKGLYNGVRLSSFSVSLVSYFDVIKSISIKAGIQYLGLSTHIDQFQDLAVPGINRFLGATFVNDAQAIEPALELLHRPGNSKRFSYGIFATYYYILNQSGWFYKQNGKKADLPNLTNENNFRLGLLCAYSFPD